MSYQFAHLFIYRGKIHTSQKTMYFYTDHDMSRGDKSVSTLVSLLAFSVCVSMCESPYHYIADLSSTLGFTSQNTLHTCACLYEHVLLYSYHISCSYLASFHGLHVLLLQSHLMRIGAETCNTQYLNTNPTCLQFSSFSMH